MLRSLQKKDIFMVALAGVFFAAGIFTDVEVLFAVAYFIAGYPAIIEALYSVRSKELFNENFLMIIASAGAVFCGQYSEAVAIMLFNRIGEMFEHCAVNSSRESIGQLMDIAPLTAMKLEEGKEIEVDPQELEVGDIVIVRPGEKIPVDGVIVKGSSALDTSALTGESVPVDVSENDKVISGSINMTGLVNVKCLKKYEDSTVMRVLELVENSAERKANVENFISKFAKWYTPLVVFGALLTVLIPVVGFGKDIHHWIYVAAEFLVISCPCALVISVPMSLFAGIGAASKHGILVKGSNYLEAMSEASIIAFDKTGTLTEGKFVVSDIYPAEGISKKELLTNAAAGEAFSNHPVAVAVKKASEQKIKSEDVLKYKEIPGKGTSVEFEGKQINCGNLKLMKELDIKIEEIRTTGSVVYVASDGKYVGAIVVADEVRSESAELMADLKKLGVRRTVMLTGDKKEAAAEIAEKIGVTEYYAELLPGDKVDAIEKLMNSVKRSKDITAFVGDGINDAPVLARVDAGIAMGAFGSDAAVEAADIVIMNDDISLVGVLIGIAKKTLRLCRENIVFALGTKILVMALAPFGIVNMWMAVFADVGVSVIAVMNSMRALNYK